jgi:hypothetical protein
MGDVKGTAKGIALDIGDLVRWKEPMGGPPFFIHGDDTFTMNSSYLGIIYDITYDGTLVEWGYIPSFYK